MVKQQAMKPNGLSPSAIALILALRRLWTEHVLWTRSFLISTIMDNPDLEAVTKRLLRNPADFKTQLQTVYGPQIAKQFENLFTEHLSIASEYINAIKAKNTEVMKAKREAWYENATDIATFLGEINPNFNKMAWEQMLFEHLAFTEKQVAELMKEQYAKSIAEFDATHLQALRMADEMARGIIAQFGL